ncbi:MAG: Tim44/TimA family putative adaptor protein, partial [Parvibaculales bacterium]
LVGFIFWRLRNVLGMRDEDDKDNETRGKGAYGLHREAFLKNDPDAPKADAPKPDAKSKEPPAQEQPAESSEQTSSQTPSQASSQEPAEIGGRGLAVFRQHRPDFDEQQFLAGAHRAYELVLQAFAAGDLSSVENFLSPDVQAGFAQAIAQRGQTGRSLMTEITRLERPILEDALIENGMVKLAVRYRAELISILLAAGEAVPEPRPNPTTSRDLWIFEQKLATPNAIWVLAATEAE